MAIHTLYSDDLDGFAEFVGVDPDLFYEVYYNLDNRELEAELAEEEEAYA